ncbi:MAG: GGDEF domain-containing protein [Lachnospiraceae bacterium]|nr:GGDEF domain-containing protein [Lachnospiraceae bacterium]
MVILVSLHNNIEKRSATNRFFFALVLTSIAGLTFDASCYIAEEFTVNRIFLILLNVLAFSVINICIIFFSIYMFSFIRKKTDISFKLLYPVIAISALDIALIITGVFNGRFFTVMDGHIVYGPWDEYITFIPIFSVVIVLFILLFYARILGNKDTVVLGSFVVFPIISAALLLFFPDLETAYLATSLSCAIIYTFVRREEINEEQIREQIINKLSKVDTLTGLLNRRGYNDALVCANEYDRLGIVFCDLNALKFMNDNYGHVAGDDYIRKFADILRQVFDDKGSICRISGDEFIVILYDISKNRLDELKADLDKAIRENNRIASVGYAYGEKIAVMELIKQAEQEMYDDKNRYYKETGLDRRRCP